MLICCCCFSIFVVTEHPGRFRRKNPYKALPGVRKSTYIISANIRHFPYRPIDITPGGNDLYVDGLVDPGLYVSYSRSSRLDGWTRCMRFYVLSNSISAMSGQWVGDNERLCAMDTSPVDD